MQGGHVDGLRFRVSPMAASGAARGGIAGDLDDDNRSVASETDSVISVEDPIHLGHQLDMTVLLLRESFGTILAMPVAWMQLHPTVDSLREHKLRRIESGVETILWIQRFRTPLFDFIMQAFSFLAEEEFYLILLPLLFWNGAYTVASRLTMIVVCGLFMGNTVKDIFELPRPGARVWHPTLNLDSTHLQDFGFPSTHAMNAVTNSLLVATHFAVDTNQIAWQTAFPLAVAYIVLLCLSRLYLGAHTGTDVRGGLGLGTIVFTLYLVSRTQLEQLWRETRLTSLISVSLFSCALLLLLCPQPRPITPTFHQNALLVGLFLGLLWGQKMAQEWELINNMPGGWKFTLFGFVMMLVIRQLVKMIIVFVLEQVFGVHTKPREEVVRKRSFQSKTPGKKKRMIRLFTRDIDIIAVAVVKVVTYASAAMWITVGNVYMWKMVHGGFE